MRQAEDLHSDLPAQAHATLTTDAEAAVAEANWLRAQSLLSEAPASWQPAARAFDLRLMRVRAPPKLQAAMPQADIDLADAAPPSATPGQQSLSHDGEAANLPLR